MSVQSMAIKSKRTSKPARRPSGYSSSAKHLAQPAVKPTRNLPIQAKLTIGQPNDKYEQEADRVADQVMRMSDADVAQRVETGTVQPMRIQRLCPECEEETAQRQPENEEEEERLQAKEMPGQTPAVTQGLESRINSLKSGGLPLDPATRTFFEPRFGHDFSHVRVHSDDAAADIAKSINARAFTLGNHIAMSSGEYQPNSQSGQRLLGHELTHVIQQRDGRTGSKIQKQGSIESDPIDIGPTERPRSRRLNIHERGLTSHSNQIRNQNDNTNTTRELEWERRNPAGRLDNLASSLRDQMLGNYHLILWNFSVSGHFLKLEHKELLKHFVPSIGGAIRNNKQVILIGRASDSGIASYNVGLSRGRVQAVKQHLRNQIILENPEIYSTPRLSGLGELRLLDENIIERYYGQQRPLRPNITPELMAYNRSVEIILQSNNSRERVPCNFSLANSSLPNPVKRFLSPYIEAEARTFTAGTPVVREITNRLTGEPGGGNFLIKMCCPNARPLGIIWLLPTDESYYEFLQSKGLEGPSAFALSQSATNLNNAYIMTVRAHPCERLGQIRSRVHRAIDRNLRVLLRSLISIFGPTGRGGMIGEFIKLLESLLSG